MVLYYRRKRRKILAFIVLPLLIFFAIFFSFFQISPIFVKLSEDKIYLTAFSLINNIILSELEKTDANNLIEYKYSTAGEIIAVNPNVLIMNRLNNSISQEISKQLSSLDTILIKLPIGSFINSSLLSGIGPKIPVHVVPLNNVTTEYITEFSSTGINQTCHKIFIKVTCKLQVLSKLVQNEQIVNVQIPVAETIIVGNVPTTYLELNK